MAKLTNPRFMVQRGGDEFTVQASNVELVAWDKTRAKKHWPTAEDAPFLWMTFVSWAAARRAGAIGSSVTYEEYEETAEDITPVDADNKPLAAGEEGGEEVFPIPRAAAPD